MQDGQGGVEIFKTLRNSHMIRQSGVEIRHKSMKERISHMIRYLNTMILSTWNNKFFSILFSLQVSIFFFHSNKN